MLKDDYPNFGNFSGGLSLLEIPPLDLKQVEIIKGPASTFVRRHAVHARAQFYARRHECDRREGRFFTR